MIARDFFFGIVTINFLTILEIFVGIFLSFCIYRKLHSFITISALRTLRCRTIPNNKRLIGGMARMHMPVRRVL